MRCERLLHRPLLDTALRLIALGERYGVYDGFVINALREDLSVSDGNARLWPQCERLKACLLAATSTGQQQYWTAAQAAARSLCSYLDTRVRGLWFDTRAPGGALGGAAAPASSFYHLVGAIAALHRVAPAAP
jgi:mannose/cellobiose epimerase-like protein (N-acyl-D-glucosamine 2-epimerase family)